MPEPHGAVSNTRQFVPAVNLNRILSPSIADTGDPITSISSLSFSSFLFSRFFW